MGLTVHITIVRVVPPPSKSDAPLPQRFLVVDETDNDVTLEMPHELMGTAWVPKQFILRKTGPGRLETRNGLLKYQVVRTEKVAER